MRQLLLFFVFTACLCHAKGQAPDTLSYPEVGKPMPDLVIRNIAYYTKKQATVRDFRGKWLMLDFWDIHCGACIRSFPRINRIQQTFKRQLQVIMVGVQDPENKTQPLFAKFRERQHLNFPCAFDSALAQRLDLYYMPHTILIDDKGIVRTIVVAIDTSDIQEFLAGRSPDLPQTYRRMKDYDTMVDRRVAFNSSKPFLVKDNGGNDSDFLCRSLLSIWHPGSQFFSRPDDFRDAAKTGQFQVLGASLDWLYNYAYFGKYSWGPGDSSLYGNSFDRPVLEIRDSSSFKYDRRFCYSQIRPTAGNSEKIMQETMQRDLLNFFGLRATIESRKCPYWKIIALPGTEGKLQTKGGAVFAHELSLDVGWTMSNCSISDLVDCVRGHDPGRDPMSNIYLDETGFAGNIDITLDCIMSDLDDVRRALQAYGLDLVKGEKSMKVLVISNQEHY